MHIISLVVCALHTSACQPVRGVSFCGYPNSHTKTSATPTSVPNTASAIKMTIEMACNSDGGS
jgi:hypothetical protein